MLDMLVVT